MKLSLKEQNCVISVTGLGEFWVICDCNSHTHDPGISRYKNTILHCTCMFVYVCISVMNNWNIALDSYIFQKMIVI